MLFQGLPIGTVPYLNAVPLTTGLEEQLVALTPSRLALEFQAGRLAAALLSVTEALQNPGVEVLEGVAIACRGPVYSVILAHREPLEEMREIYVDAASRTSVNLLRVWLEAQGLHPLLRPLVTYDRAGDYPNVVLIGNAAIEFRQHRPSHRILDLGSAWFEMTGLPFVFAVWMFRQGHHSAELRMALSRAQADGLRQIDRWVAGRTESTPDFRRRYLGGYIRYQLGSEEKRGLEKFAALLQRTQVSRLFPIRYVLP